MKRTNYTFKCMLSLVSAILLSVASFCIKAQAADTIASNVNKEPHSDIQLVFEAELLTDEEKTSISDEVHDTLYSFFRDYYNAIWLYSAIDNDDYISNNGLREYLKNKIAAKQYRSEVYGKNDIENLSVKLSVHELKTDGAIIEIDNAVTASYNYKGSAEESGFGEKWRVFLTNRNDRYVIIDACSSDSYDEGVRGDLSKVQLSDWKEGDRELLRKQAEIDNKIITYYHKMKQDLKEHNDFAGNKLEEKKGGTRASLYSLSKTAIKNWALNNCSLTSPSSGNPSLANYYDFSQITGNFDCTNFVSHAILAGGSNEYDNGNPNTGWYYNSLSDRSYSWTVVNQLYTFIVNNSTKGPAGYGIAYNHIYAPSGYYSYNPGDIMQFKNYYGDWRHSTVITGYAAVEGSSTSLEALVTGRTSPGTYNYNQRQSTIYTGTDRRVIVLEGYYA